MPFPTLPVDGIVKPDPPSADDVVARPGKGTVVATTKVAADGRFHFDAVPPGQFVLEMVVDGKPVASPPGAGPQFTIEVKAAHAHSNIKTPWGSARVIV